jgi:hypothetical protein
MATLTLEAAPLALDTAELQRIRRTAAKMRQHQLAQRAKRAAKRSLVERIIAAGDGVRLCLHCEGGSPELLSAELVPVPAPKHPAAERARAAFDGRLIAEPECHGIRAFAWTGRPYVARPYRFLASDAAWNCGGLENDTVDQSAGGSWRFAGVRAQRSWQTKLKNPVAPDGTIIAERDGAAVLVRNGRDERALGWQRGKDADDGKRYMAHAIDASAPARSLAEWQAELERVRALHA